MIIVHEVTVFVRLSLAGVWGSGHVQKTSYLRALVSALPSNAAADYFPLSP